MQQGILLRSFQPGWSRGGRFRWFCEFSRATACVCDSKADATDEQEKEKYEYNHVQNAPIAIRFRHVPVKEDVGHPEGIAYTISRLLIATAMSRAIILTHNRSNFRDRGAENTKILPKLFLQNLLHLHRIHHFQALLCLARYVKH